MRRILDQIASSAIVRRDEVAVMQLSPCTHRATWSWSQLNDAVNSAATAISHAAGPGEVVMLSLRNRPEFIAAFLGAIAAGATVFPVHPGLTPAELREASRRSRAIAIIADAATWSRVSSGSSMHWIDVNRILEQESVPPPRDLAAHSAMLLQSSGTTGKPKIVHRRETSLSAVARNVVRSTSLSERDVVLGAIPLGHSYGVENALLAPMLAGSQIRLTDGFDVAVVAAQIASGEVTVFPGVPFMWQSLAGLACPVRAAIRLGYSAGGPLPESIAMACEQRLGVRVGQLYGSTEVGSVTFGSPDDSDYDPETVGRPMEGVLVRVVDPDDPDLDESKPTGTEGLVAIRAPSMLDRYVDDLTPAHHHGWFLTGDLGRIDASQRLTITGRVKLQIDIGGTKVNPLEVEGVLNLHPAVRECVVVPLPMNETVDRIKALVVLEEKSSAVTPEELKSFARGRLAAHKVPRVIEVCESLPRSPAGKILREACWCG